MRNAERQNGAGCPAVTGEPDDPETITSGSAGGRAEKDQHPLAPRRAADPSAWLTARRRLARDYKRDPALSEAVIRWAAINTITRRIARGGPAVRQLRREFATTS
jgi:hypothetical protein